jgi:hypothetical protein
VTDFIVFEVLRMVLSQGEKGFGVERKCSFQQLQYHESPLPLVHEAPETASFFLNMRGSWELKI